MKIDFKKMLSPERIINLTGQSKEEVLGTAKAFRAYVKRVSVEDGDYTMDHTASVLLIGSEGRLQGTVNFFDDDALFLEKLYHLTRSK